MEVIYLAVDIHTLTTMPPKSTPTPRHAMTLKRSAPPTDSTPSRPNKRRKTRGADDEEEQQTTPNTRGHVDVELDPEAELEAWQDFAADHYEMVEQLPLELHRNFRLLKELDDGCVGKSAAQRGS